MSFFRPPPRQTLPFLYCCLLLWHCIKINGYVGWFFVQLTSTYNVILDLLFFCVSCRASFNRLDKKRDAFHEIELPCHFSFFLFREGCACCLPIYSNCLFWVNTCVPFMTQHWYVTFTPTSFAFPNLVDFHNDDEISHFGKSLYNYYCSTREKHEPTLEVWEQF